jgi:hypothetical protein
MAVTTAVVTENVCINSRWKSELVAYEIHKQPLPRFMHLMLLKPDRSSFCSVYPDQFSTWFCLQNPVAIKPCIRIDRMSNQRKAEFVNDKFGIQSLWGGHGKI